MIKTHRITGLKYLCYTKKEGKAYDEYPGSGQWWLDHLKIHGKEIDTELIFESDNFKEWKAYALKKSAELNVVESKEWANLRPEQGDGGDTVSNKRWITNGVIDKYILRELPIPEGWRPGRSKCVFNDPKNQSKFGQMVDYEVRGIAIRKAWDNRENNGLGHRPDTCGFQRGDKNVACRPEVREKIRAGALRDSEARSIRAKECNLAEHGRIAQRLKRSRINQES